MVDEVVGDDTTADQLLDRGLVQYALGNADRAVVMWKSALEIEPSSDRARDYLRTLGDDEVGKSASSASAGDAQATEAPLANSKNNLAAVPEAGPGEHLADSLAPPFAPKVSFDEEESVPTDEIDVEPVVPDVEIFLRDARAAEVDGRYEEALTSAEDALKRDPERRETQELISSLRRRLRETYLDELHPLERVPVLRATDASILELSLDPIGGFLISQIDGEITVEELLTILGTFDEFRVLSSLHYFLSSGIIELR